MGDPGPTCPVITLLLCGSIRHEQKGLCAPADKQKAERLKQCRVLKVAVINWKLLQVFIFLARALQPAVLWGGKKIYIY